MTTYYVTLLGNDGNTGGVGDPWLTLNHALQSTATTDVIEMGSGTFIEAIDLFGLGLTGYVAVNLKTDTILEITKYIGSSRFVYMGGGTISITSTAGTFSPSTRRLLIDNASVDIAGSNIGDAVFYHCDIEINAINPGNIYIDCKINLNDRNYWLTRDHFMLYYCAYFYPLGCYDYTCVKVPMIDVYQFDSLFADTYPLQKFDKDDWFPYGRDSKSGYPYDAYFVPLTSLNMPMRADGVSGLVSGMDYGATDNLGNYTQDEYVFVLGDLVYFRDKLSIGNFIGKYTVTNPNRILQTPNDLESYIKNLFLESFIMDEKLLYVQGIMNTSEMPENLSHLYDIIGMDIRSVVMLCQTELWQAAGSLLAVVTLLESNTTVAGFDEYNRRHTCKIGRLPWRYDATTGGVYFRYYAEEWQANHDYYLNDIVVQRKITANPIAATDTGEGLFFWKALNAGTSAAAGVSPAPAITWPTNPSIGDTLVDNTVTWICDEVFNNDHEEMWRQFDFEKNEKLVRIDDISDVALDLDQWNYLFADCEIGTESVVTPQSYTIAGVADVRRRVAINLISGGTTGGFYNFNSATDLNTLFEQYAGDLRHKKKLPVAFLNIDAFGNLTTCIDLIGGRVSSALPEPWLPLTAYKYGDQVMAMVIPLTGTVAIPHYYRLESLTLTSGAVAPTWTPTINDAVTDGAGTWRCLGAMIGRNNNILLSQAEKGRAGQIGVDTNTLRNDAIVSEMFQHTFALDTQLYRQGYPRDWVANFNYLIGAKIFDTYSYECTRAGLSGNTIPALVKKGVAWVTATPYSEGDVVVKAHSGVLYYFICINPGTSATFSSNAASYVEDVASRESGAAQQLIWKCLGKCSDVSAYEVKDNNYRWLPSTRFKVGDVILPAVASGAALAYIYFECTTAGITDITTPTFSATTVTESTGIVWKAVPNLATRIGIDGRDTTGDAKWKLTGYGDIEYISFEN